MLDKDVFSGQKVYLFLSHDRLNPFMPAAAMACRDSCVVYGVAAECYLSLTAAWVAITDVACKKVASDLGLGSGFRWVLQFPTPVTIGRSRLGCNMAETSDENPKFLQQQ